MKKAKIVVREKIFGINDDIGLCALDGYYESPTVAFEDTATKDEMLDKIEKIIQDKYDTFLADSIELKVF